MVACAAAPSQRSSQVERRPVFSLEEAIRWLERMVGEAVDWTALESFLPATEDPVFRRSVTASGFVAALELARQGSSARSPRTMTAGSRRCA